MAYMNAEKKKELAPGIKAVLKKYKMRGTIAVSNYSKLIVNIWEGPLDIIGNYNANNDPTVSGWKPDDYMRVNEFWIDENFTGEVKAFLSELNAAMNAAPGLENYDNSDSMTDYFDVGWYTAINVGDFGKPYKLNLEKAA